MIFLQTSIKTGTTQLDSTTHSHHIQQGTPQMNAPGDVGEYAGDVGEYAGDVGE